MRSFVPLTGLPKGVVTRGDGSQVMFEGSIVGVP